MLDTRKFAKIKETLLTKPNEPLILITEMVNKLNKFLTKIKPNQQNPKFSFSKSVIYP